MIGRVVSAHFWRRALAVAIAPVGFAQTSSPADTELAPVITADVLEVDFETKEAVYQGHARAVAGDSIFVADEIRWHRPSNMATATGNALLQQGDLRLRAEQLTYDLTTGQFTMQGLRLGRDPFYFSGDTVEGDESLLILSEAELTFGEPGYWTPTLRAKTLTYDPVNQSIKTTGGRIGLGMFSAIPFPSVDLPLNGPGLVELTVDGGASSRLGLWGRIGATVPVSTHWRAGADLGIYTNRGVMVGPAFGYDWAHPDGSSAHGRFSSGYIHDSGDQGDLGFDNLFRPIDPDRGLIQWTHRQTLGEQLTFNGELNYWSDSEVVRDFRPQEFFPVQVPDTFAELTYQSENTVAGVFVRAQPNDFHQIRQRLPELTWELLPSPIFEGVIHQAQSSIAVLREDPPGIAPEISSERLDLYYALARPWAPRNWVTISPIVGGRVTHYAEATGNQRDYTRTLGEVGVDAELKFAGKFDYQNETWNIDGLRHLITPRVSYRYIPEADKGQNFIPQIDRRVFSTYLEPLGLGARRQIDDLSPTHTLRLALDQRLQTRDEIYGSRDLVQLNLALDSRFDRPANSRTLSALHTELRLSPASFLDIDLYHRASPGDWTMRELNTAITLHSSDQWELQFANHYLENDIQEFIGAFAYRLNEVWQGYTRLHFDSRRSRFVEQTYGLRQTIANRWAIGYEFSFYEGQRRESDFGFAIRFEAIRF